MQVELTKMIYIHVVLLVGFIKYSGLFRIWLSKVLLYTKVLDHLGLWQKVARQGDIFVNLKYCQSFLHRLRNVW